MRRALWTADGLELSEVEPGPLAEGWARLQVAACGICGSDLHWWHGSMRRPLGTAPGHELAGTVLDGPAGLADVLYAVSPNVSCGSCQFCRVGQTHLCDHALGRGLGMGADVVIESVGGTAPTLGEAVKAARKGGTIVLLGSFTEPRPLDLSKLMMKELRLQGSFCYGSTKRGSEYAAAAQLTGRFESELSAMTTHQFGLDQVTDAFETAADKTSGAIKVTVLPT